ncbi:hypothetical protein, partial [Rhizobium leguminosarum]|uniref:hypothetical protein n=1 Tax=Rhizobium leguminosarum TaxID=384 RepID=UPI003F9937AC
MNACYLGRVDNGTGVDLWFQPGYVFFDRCIQQRHILRQISHMLTGIWPTLRGSVRLDDAELTQWSDADLGQHV